MKPFVSRSTVGLLTTLASLGIANANIRSVRIPYEPANQAIVERLISDGLITPSDTANWYQINQENLAEAFNQAEAGDISAAWTIQNLKMVLGEETEIREVKIFSANIGSQDLGK